MKYLGIDPGLTGAVAIIHENGTCSLYDPPSVLIKNGKKTRGEYDIQEMTKIIRDYSSGTHAIIENGIAMPGLSSNTVATVFHGIGIWKGIMAAYGIPFSTIAAATWKKEFSLWGKDKNASILRAKELFPDADITLKKHDGRAEALLMAEYLRRTLGR